MGFNSAFKGLNLNACSWTLNHFNIANDLHQNMLIHPLLHLKWQDGETTRNVCESWNSFIRLQEMKQLFYVFCLLS